MPAGKRKFEQNGVSKRRKIVTAPGTELHQIGAQDNDIDVTLRARQDLWQKRVKFVPSKLQDVSQDHTAHPGKDKDGFLPPSRKLFDERKLQLQWKTTNRVGAGLKNLGNTCFLNSVLQCLTYTPCIANYLESPAHAKSCVKQGFCALCALGSHIRSSFKPAHKVMTPQNFVHKLRLITPHFRLGQQEDAHEFLRFLIEAVQQACLAPYPGLDHRTQETTFVHAVFGGYLRSQIRCKQCGTLSNVFDPCLDISLDIKHSASLEKAFRSFVKPETLSGGNQFNCHKCKQRRDATKRVTIHRLPNVLTVHLKRFDFTRLFGSKINKHVSFPPTLDMKPYVSDSKTCGPSKYHLYAVLTHAGFSVDSGHYYAFVRNSNGSWYCMNDASVQQTSLKTVLAQKAYLLFYTRKEHGNGEESRPLASLPVTGTNSIPQSSVRDPQELFPMQAAMDSSDEDDETTENEGRLIVSPRAHSTLEWDVRYSGPEKVSSSHNVERATNDGWNVKDTLDDRCDPESISKGAKSFLEEILSSEASRALSKIDEEIAAPLLQSLLIEARKQLSQLWGSITEDARSDGDSASDDDAVPLSFDDFNKDDFPEAVLHALRPSLSEFVLLATEALGQSTSAIGSAAANEHELDDNDGRRSYPVDPTVSIAASSKAQASSDKSDTSSAVDQEDNSSSHSSNPPPVSTSGANDVVGTSGSVSWDGRLTSKKTIAASIAALASQSEAKVTGWDENDESILFSQGGVNHHSGEHDDDFDEEYDRGRTKRVKGPKTPQADLGNALQKVYEKSKRRGKPLAQGVPEEGKRFKKRHQQKKRMAAGKKKPSWKGRKPGPKH